MLPLRGLKWLALGESVDAFALFMRSQLDLRHEAANLERFRANFGRAGAPRVASFGIIPSRILHTVPAMFMGTNGTIVRKARRQCSSDRGMYLSNSSMRIGLYSVASRASIQESTMGFHSMSSWFR